jgi:hypothetical protein
VFSHDAVKYVYQDPNVQVVNYNAVPTKIFKVDAPEKSKKSKKDLEKNKKEEKDKGFIR